MFESFSVIYSNGREYIDRDTRPKTHPCRHCARDVESSKHCVCVPSAPMFQKQEGVQPPKPFVIRATR